MPSRTVPTLARTEFQFHSSRESCYVTIDDKIYDMTEFAQNHPGGPDLILNYAGQDVKKVLQKATYHAHSRAAYDILDDCLVGFVVPTKNTSNGSSKSTSSDAERAEEKAQLSIIDVGDLGKETECATDIQRRKFLDPSRPLIPQIWFGGFSKDFYLDQVHRPRHFKSCESATLFGNFLEPLTKAPWWLVPTLWMPLVICGTCLCAGGFNSGWTQAGCWVSGIGVWSLIEYIVHRFFFHLDCWLPDNRVGITLHFLLHGIHHYLPMDKYRLVMPPALFLTIAFPFWKLAHFILYSNWDIATTVYCGSVFGYICYDLTHYCLHHRDVPRWCRGLKKYHLKHHFLDYNAGFGVTSGFWDRFFGTELLT